MAEEEDSALDLSAEPSRENSKEWASSFTVDGVQYAASIFWESLQNVDAPFLDAKEAAENVLVGADCFASSTANPLSLDWQFLPRALRKE